MLFNVIFKNFLFIWLKTLKCRDNELKKYQNYSLKKTPPRLFVEHKLHETLKSINVQKQYLGLSSALVVNSEQSQFLRRHQ